MGREKNSIIYLYCITNCLPNVNDLYNLDQEVYIIYHKGLYAVVSKVSLDEFCRENIKGYLGYPEEWFNLKSSIHTRLIETVMKYTCAVPFGFATLFHSEEILKEMIEKHKDTLSEHLQSRDGKKNSNDLIFLHGTLQKGFARFIPQANIPVKDTVNYSSAIERPPALEKKRESSSNDTVKSGLRRVETEGAKGLKQHNLDIRGNPSHPGAETKKENSKILCTTFNVDDNKTLSPVQPCGNSQAGFLNRASAHAYPKRFLHLTFSRLMEKAYTA